MMNAPGSMLTPGDVVELELGTPTGSEAGLNRPAVVVTAHRILRGHPNVIQVVPLTGTIRSSVSEVSIEPDEQNGLTSFSAAQCQHIRSVVISRVGERLGNVGPTVVRQIRENIAVIVDV
ncbi:MAG: type II toxin-antitoxin system PemK/MazF family toxin [Corynebacterium sp.]|uniref:type II toxin-antitoxin system PemK/MazF family toxin n=1 Tax=Corynebacterium sp. TaxID=1720 RepID=UPI003F9867DE